MIALKQKPLLGKFHLKSSIIVETGLHIGGGSELLNIGGIDHAVVRDPLTQHPYLPGSSIKGKLRSILERFFNKPLNRNGGSGTYRYESDDIEDGYTQIDGQLIPYQGAKNCPISRSFGSTGANNCWIKKSIAEEQKLKFDETRSVNGEEEEYAKIKGRNTPARLIIRDCYLEEDSADKLKRIDTGLYMTEWKFENGIDRVTSAANPRQLERVPAGSRFKFEMVYTVEDIEQAVEDLKNIAIALTILEDDALGGHGSRGYGKIRFDNFYPSYHDFEAYRQQIETEKASFKSFISKRDQPIKNTSELLNNFNEIQNLLPPEEEK